MAALLTISGCGQPDPSPSMSEPAPPPSSAPANLTATGEPLPAGRYTRARFTPAISIELDGSWEAVQLADGFFDVQLNPGAADVIAVQFTRPRGVFGANAATEAVATAEEAVAALRSNPELVVVESSDSRIGGLEGLQITVENAGPSHAGVMQVPPGALGIDPGRRLWIAFFDTPDGLLAIMVGGSTAKWDEALAAAEPVLESVRIG
jgi:hypothetical protein